jgi:hypothetical protein
MSSIRGVGGVRRGLSLACLVGSLLVAHGTGSGTAGEPRGLVYNCRLVATKLGEEITLTFRLHTDGARDTWRIRLFHEGDLVFSKPRLTNAEGNIKVVRIEPNLAGIDDFEAQARHLETGDLCRVETGI